MSQTQLVELEQRILATTGIPFKAGDSQAGRWRTRYIAAGPPTAPAVIFIHGTGGSRLNWLKPMIALAPLYRVYAADLPGWGQASLPNFYKHHPEPLYAHFVKDLMETLGIKQATLVGSSLGGWIIIQTALRWPERVHSLVGIGVGGFGPTTHPATTLAWALASQSWLASLVGHFFKPSPHFVRDWLGAGTPPTSPESELLAEYYAAVFSRPGLMRSIASLGAVLMKPWHQKWDSPLLPRLSELHMPVLLAWGEQDTTNPLQSAINALNYLPNGHLHVFPNTGHPVHTDQPEAFSQVLLDFLRTI